MVTTRAEPGLLDVPHCKSSRRFLCPKSGGRFGHRSISAGRRPSHTLNAQRGGGACVYHTGLPKETLASRSFHPTWRGSIVSWSVGRNGGGRASCKCNLTMMYCRPRRECAAVSVVWSTNWQLKLGLSGAVVALLLTFSPLSLLFGSLTWSPDYVALSLLDHDI